MKKYVLLGLVILLCIIYACQHEIERGLKKQPGRSARIHAAAGIIGSDTVNVYGDAYVQNGIYASDNFGDHTAVEIKGTNIANEKRNGYLRFDVSSIPANAVNIRLNIHAYNVLDTSTVPITVYQTDTPFLNFNEMTVTYTSRPSHPSSALGVINVNGTDPFHSLDVTAYVKDRAKKPNATASFCLIDEPEKNQLVWVSSKEGAWPPYLSYDLTDDEEQEEPQEDTIAGSGKPDHIFVIWMENTSYNQIIGNNTYGAYFNYIASQGTVYDSAYGLYGTSSQPNYFAVYGGSDNNKTDNTCYSGFTTNTLYTALSGTGKTIAWYSEDLPSDGSTTCTSGSYYKKHNPTAGTWTTAKSPTSLNKRWNGISWTDTSIYRNMANIVFITPNQQHDRHDGNISAANSWLQTYYSGLVQWVLKPENKSQLWVYYDEEDDDNSSQDQGFYPGGDKRIPITAIGYNVKKNYHSKVKYRLQTNSSQDCFHYGMAKYLSVSFGGDTTNTNFRTRVDTAKRVDDHLIKKY